MGKSNIYLTYYLSKQTRIYALCPDIDLLGSNGGSTVVLYHLDLCLATVNV